MRRVFAILSVLPLLAGSATAQERSGESRNSWYLFAAPGAISVNVDRWTQSTVQLGGGYEWVFFKGLGAEIDGGALAVGRDLPGWQWTAMFSLNGLYRFRPPSPRTVAPFVVAGVAAVPEFDVAGGYDWGIGVDYWINERHGVRIEFRDLARPGDLHTYHDVQVRVGLSFRR